MRRLFTIAAIVCFSLGFLGVGGAAADDPPHNLSPSAHMAAACNGRIGPTKACDTAAINNINRAHKQEGLGPIVLPENYASLTLTQQEIAISNAERAARSLSSLPERRAYDKLAKQGADAMTDPTGPSGHGWGSIWAGYADPLADDFLWMYDDGPGGPNLDCQNPGDPGCWGHRNIILFPDWTAMGAGHDHASMAELFVQ